MAMATVHELLNNTLSHGKSLRVCDPAANRADQRLLQDASQKLDAYATENFVRFSLITTIQLTYFLL
jgi:hypothetical protein